MAMKCFHLSHIYILEPPFRSPEAPFSPVAVSPLPTSLGRVRKRFKDDKGDLSVRKVGG